MKTEFKQIPGFEEYTINKSGNFIYKNGQQISIFLHGPLKKRYAARIGKNIKYVHRLVALTFVKNNDPIFNKVVKHKDGNLLNNHYSNLFWGNMRDECRIKAIEQHKKRIDEKIKYNYSRTKKETEQKILKLYGKGIKINDIADILKLSKTTVKRILKNVYDEKQ